MLVCVALNDSIRSCLTCEFYIFICTESAVVKKIVSQVLVLELLWTFNPLSPLEIDTVETE